MFNSTKTRAIPLYYLFYKLNTTWIPNLTQMNQRTSWPLDITKIAQNSNLLIKSQILNSCHFNCIITWGKKDQKILKEREEEKGR